MSNTPSLTDKLSGFIASANAVKANDNVISLTDALSGIPIDGLSSDRALLDWMSAEGLLEHATCEANCE